MGTQLTTQRELSNEYQHDRIEVLFRNLCILLLWTKVAFALEGLNSAHDYHSTIFLLTVHLVNYYLITLKVTLGMTNIFIENQGCVGWGERKLFSLVRLENKN